MLALVSHDELPDKNPNKSFEHALDYMEKVSVVRGSHFLVDFCFVLL